MNELHNMIQSTDPDIIMGAESWLNSTILDGEIFPDNYSVIRKDRTSSTEGGGVFIAHRKDLILTHRPDLDTSCEAVWAQLQIKGAKSVFVGSFYRPPSDGKDSMEQFELALS